MALASICVGPEAFEWGELHDLNSTVLIALLRAECSDHSQIATGDGYEDEQVKSGSKR